MCESYEKSTFIALLLYPNSIEPKSFGELLRKKRKKSGISIKKLSLETNISYWRIQQAEHNSISLTSDELESIAHRLES